MAVRLRLAWVQQRLDAAARLEASQFHGSVVKTRKLIFLGVTGERSEKSDKSDRSDWRRRSSMATW